jgi:hypothetical protein
MNYRETKVDDSLSHSDIKVKRRPCCALCHEGVLGTGGTAPEFFYFRLHRSGWLASRSS